MPEKKSLIPRLFFLPWLSRLKGIQTCNNRPEKLENEEDEEETDEILEASSKRTSETVSLDNSDSEISPLPLLEPTSDDSQFWYPDSNCYNTLPYFYPQTLTRDLYYYRLSQTLTSIPELHPVSSSSNQFSCYCYNCLRDPISESILDTIAGRRAKGSANRSVIHSSDNLLATVSDSCNTSFASVATQSKNGGPALPGGPVVYRRNPQAAESGRNRNFWIQRRSQRNRKAMSIPEELSTGSLQRPPKSNRPPPIPLRRTMGKSTDELQRSPSSPVSSAADTSPSYFNQSMASIQQPFLSSPSQKGSSSGSKKIQDLKLNFFATWSRGTSAKKRQPQIQHQTFNQATNMDPSMHMMMMPDTVVGGLANCYGSGNTMNMRCGTSSQSSINRLNNSGFSNNRDSSSQYSDCERNSFCSSMSDEAISPDAKQRGMFGHIDSGASPFVYSRDPQIALGSVSRVGTGGNTSSISMPPQLSLPCSMMAVCDYDAIKEDQISVKAGDSVQVLSVRKSMYYVFKEATGQNTQDAEGYIPAHVVNPSCAELSHSQDSLKSPLSSSPNPNILNNTLLSLPAQRSSWHCTAPRLFDQSTMSRQSREREPKNVTNCRKSRSAAILSKQLSGSGEENNQPSIFNTFRRRHRSTSKSSTVSRRLIGSGSDVSSDGRPSEPGRPEIRKKSRTSVEIEWKPPEYTGNQLITGYTIEISRKNSNMFSPCGTMVSESFALIEDLTPGVSYQFRVSAHNQSGISLPSEASEFVTISATENNKKGRSLSEGLGKVSWSSKFDDHYIRIEEIGRGRFSTVWKCEHKKLKQAVAAKVINKNMLSKSDLESEAAVLNSLQHPNIIKTIQAYNSSGNPILVLELLPAGRLLDFIITHYSISYTEGVACNFVENVVQALHYLHLNGIAHLDLKPENVLVSVTAASATAKLIDFGDASLLITNNNNNNIPHCSTASILGSVEFCAPELIESSGQVPATAQTDMWSLGCLIYVLLTGLSPFFDETTEETCRHIIEVDYSFPAEHFQEVSESAIELIKLLLTKDSLLRITSSSCVSYPWFHDCFPVKAPVIDTERLQSFVDRRVYWSTDVRPLKKEVVKQLENS